MMRGALIGVVMAAALACCLAAARSAEPAHVHEAAPVAAALPGESLYQLPATLDSATGAHVPLAALAGRPVVVAMFYSSCTTVCPMLTLQMQRIEQALDPGDRPRVRFVMISFDAERDAPATLRAFAAEHHIDATRWLIAHAGADDVRSIAAALGIRYRQLPDKTFSHASVITLLDAHGVPLARTQVLAADDPEFLGHLRALLR